MELIHARVACEERLNLGYVECERPHVFDVGRFEAGHLTGLTGGNVWSKDLREWRWGNIVAVLDALITFTLADVEDEFPKAKG